MEESDYYKSKTTSDLPVYWYSPECLDTFKFSTKGDVWSYGVTLWEMFTLGDKPSRLLNPVMHNNAMTPYQAVRELCRCELYPCVTTYIMPMSPVGKKWMLSNDLHLLIVGPLY